MLSEIDPVRKEWAFAKLANVSNVDFWSRKSAGGQGDVGTK